MSEHAHQVTLIQWFDVQYPDLRIFAIPNGGQRNKLVAHKLKLEGVRPGVPDLFLPVARGAYHGLFIEMKAPEGGRVSKEQKDWIEWLNGAGYKAVVCKGFDEARAAIEEYLALQCFTN